MENKSDVSISALKNALVIDRNNYFMTLRKAVK